MLRRGGGLLVLLSVPLVLSGCPETAGCLSDEDCPEGFHCDPVPRQCRAGDPGGLSSSSSGGAASSTSTSLAPSSSSGRSSSSTDPGPVVVTGTFTAGPARVPPSSSGTVMVQGSLEWWPRLSASRNGLRVEGRFE